jgi:hypothetical protein
MTKYLAKLAFVAVVSIAGTGVVLADDIDKKTTITTNEAMQLPDSVLQPGTYVFKLQHTPDKNRNAVQIFDRDQNLITTVLAFPNLRLRRAGKSVFAFWEAPAGQPKALRAWFYPGEEFGQEFAYPKTEASSITANNTGGTVPTDVEAYDDGC